MTDYPSYDFRQIIQSITPQSPDFEINRLINSISREPLSELLKYWTTYFVSLQEDRNEEYIFWLKIFRDGLTRAVSNERYPMFLMSKLTCYSEFYEAILRGYLELWCRLRFSLDIQEGCYQLYIASIRGQDIFIPDNDKIRLIQLISHKLVWPMQIGENLINTSVLTSRKSENIYYRIIWLENAIYQQKLSTVVESS